MVAICEAQLTTVVRGTVPFDVTRKHGVTVTFRSLITMYKGLPLFSLVVAAGLYRNPFVALLTAPWWCLMMLSPLTILGAHVHIDEMTNGDGFEL